MESTYNCDFEHKTIDKIYGEPNTRSLQKVFKQLRRNARSVTSPLGGGQYGHLFMVMPQDEWDNLPGIAYQSILLKILVNSHSKVVQQQQKSPFDKRIMKPQKENTISFRHSTVSFAIN